MLIHPTQSWVLWIPGLNSVPWSAHRCKVASHTLCTLPCVLLLVLIDKKCVNRWLAEWVRTEAKENWGHHWSLKAQEVLRNKAIAHAKIFVALLLRRPHLVFIASRYQWWCVEVLIFPDCEIIMVSFLRFWSMFVNVAAEIRSIPVRVVSAQTLSLLSNRQQ